MKNKIIAPLLLAFSLSGCAFTPDAVTLEYAPQANVSSIDQAQNIPVHVEVLDSRSNPSAVSHKKNGMGIEMAAIGTTEDVASTVKKAVQAELKSRGFPLSATSAEAKVQISGNLSRFYNNYEMGMMSADAVTDFSMMVSVKSQSGSVLFSKNIAVQEKEEGVMLMGADNAKIALDKALSKGIRELFNDPAFIQSLKNI